MARAKANGHRIIGSEDLVEALFRSSERATSSARLIGSSKTAPLPKLEADEGTGEETLGRMFIVGGLAGMFETALVQPLVYWKTMSQVSLFVLHLAPIHPCRCTHTKSSRCSPRCTIFIVVSGESCCS